VGNNLAESNPVWIVKHYYTANKIIEDGEYGDGGGGGGVEHDSTPPPPPFDCTIFQNPNKFYQVLVGYVRVRDQLDPFFGLRNSGGAEITVVRGKAFLAPDNPQPTADTKPVNLSKITRKAIKDKRWNRYEVEYELSWSPSETQYVIGCYERDNDGSITIGGTAKAKFKIGDNAEQKRKHL
jgi:hypothetical protein